jgi:hypothetical protein
LLAPVKTLTLNTSALKIERILEGGDEDDSPQSYVKARANTRIPYRTAFPVKDTGICTKYCAHCTIFLCSEYNPMARLSPFLTPFVFCGHIVQSGRLPENAGRLHEQTKSNTAKVKGLNLG